VVAATNQIDWLSSDRLSGDNLASGRYSFGDRCGEFAARFRHAADGRCVSLRHGNEFVGVFKTVAAAKRRAAAIVKAISSPAK